MKEVKGKTNKSGSRLITKLVINNNDVTSEVGIANEFYKFLTSISPELVRKISTASKTFASFSIKKDTAMPADSTTLNELKEALTKVQTRKSPGYDEIPDIIKNCFSKLNDPLRYLFEKPI